MFTITFTQSALDDVASLKKAEQTTVIAVVERQLTTEPLKETRNRKPLTDNPLASWELRAGDLRVFYDVDEAASEVLVKAVGVKEHNKLFIRGKEFKL